MRRKQVGCFTLIIAGLLLVGGCNAERTREEKSDFLQEKVAVSDRDGNKIAVTQETKKPQEENVVDIDLTQMSSTMVYAEVYNMMVAPEAYEGKKIKLDGSYYAEFFEETGKYYHFIVIDDATACCQQGMEFLWNGEYSYPDDYPEVDAQIEITGTFTHYKELGEIYYCIVTNEIAVV